MSEVEVRVVEAIEAYLGHRTSLDDLQSALLDATWDNEKPPAVALEAQHLIAEATREQRARQDLDTALLEAVKRAHRQYA